MQTEVIILRCPECETEVGHTVYHNGFRAAATSIGPSIIECPQCAFQVETGQKEWGQFGLLRKSWYVISRVFWLFVASIFVCGGFAALFNRLALDQGWIVKEQSNLLMLKTYIIATLVLSCLFIRRSWKEIHDSLQRYHAVDPK